MIPSHIRLFTWLDVEEVFEYLRNTGEWPSWLLSVRAYWDGVEVRVTPGNSQKCNEWLHKELDPRYKAKPLWEPVHGAIVLERGPSAERTLGLTISEAEEIPKTETFFPSFTRQAVISPSKRKALPAPLHKDSPAVLALHSFKGGVGRTLHALALVEAVKRKNRRVLLVDADLEAPGISWILAKRLPQPPISFSDVLALAHEGVGSPEKVAELVAQHLQSAFLDGVYVMPAFRSVAQFARLDIKPEHVVRGGGDPFIITTLLSCLGRAVGADLVVVDLRAGISELAAGLLLDPRVYRLLVSTLSAQSLSGMLQMLDLISGRAPSSQASHPLPGVAIAQVPEEWRSTDRLIDVEDSIRTALQATSMSGSDESDHPIVLTDYDPNLAVLSGSWDEVVAQIGKSRLLEQVESFLDWVPFQRKPIPERPPLSLPAKRDSLAQVSSALELAETGAGDDFLTTSPLRRLASDHNNQLPIVVVVGAKGAGKTYTYLQVIKRQRWKAFAGAAGSGESIDALISPLLEARNLHDAPKEVVARARDGAATALGKGVPISPIVLYDFVRDALSKNYHESNWRDIWLDAIAWNAGYKSLTPGVGREFCGLLGDSNVKLVVLVDGLEDMFQTFSEKESQQIALRALLQDLPEWLSQQPGRPLGLIVFVRQDILLAAIKQNPAQLRSKYEPYALKWDRTEALRLMVWVAAKAQIVRPMEPEQLRKEEEVSLKQLLTPLWGKKLGSDDSREGRSAEWVIAALSDFKGQIQARDLVRLTKIAASKSLTDAHWNDRVLAPNAIRDALPECSMKKIEEIASENASLKQIFAELKALQQEKRQVPFLPNELGLSVKTVKVLEDNGVILSYKGEYYMPEIFRLGLGYQLKVGARPSVLTLARRASGGN